MNTKEEMLNFENEYTLKGYNVIAGMDEAGRGPLAGPVVCACAIMPLNSDKIIEGVNDSKKLTSKKRDELYEKIKDTAVCYSIQEVDNKTIDKINKERAKHYKYYTNRNWQDYTNYDLVLNTDILGVEGSAKLIEDFVKNKNNNI